MYPTPDISYSSMTQTSVVVQNLLRSTSVSQTVAVGDMFLHHKEFGDDSLFGDHVFSLQRIVLCKAQDSLLCYISQRLDFVLKFFTMYNIVQYKAISGFRSFLENNRGVQNREIRYIRLCIHMVESVYCWFGSAAFVVIYNKAYNHPSGIFSVYLSEINFYPLFERGSYRTQLTHWCW